MCSATGKLRKYRIQYLSREKGIGDLEKPKTEAVQVQVWYTHSLKFDSRSDQ